MKFREYLNRFVHRFILWDNLYKLVDNYEKSQYWSKEQLEEMQLSRLKEILLFSMKNTRHYARLLKNLEVNSFHDIDSLLSDLPVLEKEMLINNIELFKPSDSVRLKYKKNSTSGSSGRKLIFYTELYNYHTQAIRYRSEKWMGIGLFPKTYTIWGANWDVSLANNGFKNRLKSWFKNSVVLNGYNLRDRDMENYLIQMRKANVEKLVSYPSILYALAKYSKENKLPLDPKVVVSAGERLYDYQRILIESVFKCKVFNFYASRDIPVIAQECDHGRMHIMSENVIVEIQNDQGVICREGEGDLIITYFHNRATPFIRYRNGDRVRLSNTPCSCGRNLPVLDEVIGRTFELITFPNGNRVSGTFWTLISKSVQGIDEIEIIQKKDGRIIFRYVSQHEIDEEKLRFNIFEYSGSSLLLEFERVEFIVYGKNGKQNFIRKEKDYG